MYKNTVNKYSAWSFIYSDKTENKKKTNPILSNVEEIFKKIH